MKKCDRIQEILESSLRVKIRNKLKNASRKFRKSIIRASQLAYQYPEVTSGIVTSAYRLHKWHSARKDARDAEYTRRFYRAKPVYPVALEFKPSKGKGK